MGRLAQTLGLIGESFLTSTLQIQDQWQLKRSNAKYSGWKFMGKVTAIIIGFISFLAVLASGNTGGAVIFGVAMFAMSYGAFAWRPGEQSKSPEDKVLDVKSSNLQTNSNKEDAKMSTILSAAEQAAANSFALQFMEMGLEESEALKSANKIVTEVLAEFRPRGIDPFKSTQGNEYIAKETFTAPRLAAGLTMEDIRQHWNRPLLISQSL